MHGIIDGAVVTNEGCLVCDGASPQFRIACSVCCFWGTALGPNADTLIMLCLHRNHIMSRRMLPGRFLIRIPCIIHKVQGSTIIFQLH